MEFDAGLAIAQVALIPLIVSLIEFFKRFFPNAHGNVWLGASMVLGITGQVAAFIASAGMPSGFPSWLTLVVLGMAFGLAASKAYDETLDNAS